MTMMQVRMFGQSEEASEYSDLTDAVCATIPLCAAARGLSAAGQGAISEATGTAAAQVKEAIGSGMAPALAQLQRLETTITWAAVGTIAALLIASGAVVYVAVTRRR